MRAKRENTAIVGIAVASCAVCCAGPIIGILAAMGLGTATGFALFGAVAALIGAATLAFVLVLVLVRRRRASGCEIPELAAVPVELTATRTRT